MKTAEELYDEVVAKGVISFTPEELRDICKMILKARGDRAMIIYTIKFEGWWDDSVADPCRAILEAPGDRAWAICLAKNGGWWDDSVAEPCQAILDSPGNQAFAIYLAKQAGWWDDAVAEPCRAILNAQGERAMAIHYAKFYGWWDDSVADPCQAILDSPGYLDPAINLSKGYDWWKDDKTGLYKSTESRIVYIVIPEQIQILLNRDLSQITLPVNHPKRPGFLKTKIGLVDMSLSMFELPGESSYKMQDIIGHAFHRQAMIKIKQSPFHSSIFEVIDIVE